MTNNLIKDKVLDVAVEWWAEKAKGSHHSNGDDSFGGFLCSFLSDSNNKEVSNENIEKFKKALKEEIIKFNEEYGGDTWISVDYNPCCILSDACKRSEIPENNLPWKTSSTIGKNFEYFRYSDGYRQEYIYSILSMDYIKETIERIKENIKIQTDELTKLYKEFSDCNNQDKKYLSDKKEYIDYKKEYIDDLKTSLKNLCKLNNDNFAFYIGKFDICYNGEGKGYSIEELKND